MGTFAEIAILDYLFIVCRSRKTNFRFSFSFGANKWKFAVSLSICRKQAEVALFC
jgi:hypothetical protein